MHNKNQIVSGHKGALLIAEISANHDQNLEQALALVDIAADCGWDCLKLQTYSADSLTMRSQHSSLLVDPVWGSSNLYDLYTKAAMPMEFHEPLFTYARELGLVPFTSVYDPRDLDFIEKLDCPIYKISSFEMTFDQLLAETAKIGKPIILSTGMATLAEIEHALEVLDKNGSVPVILLHCCSSYPAPAEQINLRAMRKMEMHFNRSVGFSDHTIGSRAPLAAVALGAVAIEKHFTNDTGREGPDHRFSATPKVMKDIAIGVREIQTLLGSEVKQLTEAEMVSREKGRRSAFALIDLPKGHVVNASDFRFIRPNAGIAANQPESLIGKVLLNDVPQGFPITSHDIAA
ncbi:N-acetylneuraminate synthase family protein [Granulosicoccus sp.]|nr:N-acetylneuraminate synthase family protein [Granulosicoccus sp.]